MIGWWNNIMTENLTARRCFVQGIKLLEKNTRESIFEARYWLEKSVEMEENRPEPSLMLSEVCHRLNDIVSCYNYTKKCIYLARKMKEEFDNDFWGTIYCKLAFSATTLGKNIEGVDAYRKAWQYSSRGTRAALEMFDSMLLGMHCLNYSSQDLYEIHLLYNTQVSDVMPYRYDIPYKHKKIRIGYITGDFRFHVMFFIYYGLIFYYNKDEFSVYCYHTDKRHDGYTERIKNHVDCYRNVADLEWCEIANKIHEDEVDILLDLSGHSAGNALPVFTYRPAPIQMSGLGYMNTTGLSCIDYFITDAIVDPVGEHEQLFTEKKMLYMPSQYSYINDENIPNSRFAPVIKNGYVTFCSFNRYRKINDDMLSNWREILQRVPNSKLLLKNDEFSSDSVMNHAYLRLRDKGFDMARVILEPPTRDYMTRYLEMDIALDTYPYTGGGTTFDALYMGVPVITKYGEKRNTRFGLSILSNIGLKELAVSSNKEYIEKAVCLANNRELLNDLHGSLRTILRDAKTINPRFYIEELEKKYKDIIAHAFDDC